MRILKLTAALMISTVALTIAVRQIGLAAPLPTRITRWHLHDPNCQPPTCFLGIRPEHSLEDIEKILAQRFPDFKLSCDGETVSAIYFTGLEPQGSYPTVHIRCSFHRTVESHYCQIQFNHTQDETPTLGDVLNLWGVPTGTSWPHAGGWLFHYGKHYIINLETFRVRVNPKDPLGLSSWFDEYAFRPRSRASVIYWKRTPQGDHGNARWIGFVGLERYYANYSNDRERFFR